MGKDDKVQLGRILLKRKMVTQDELDKALREQKVDTSAKPLASRLIDSGTVAEVDALKALSEQYGVPGIDLRHVIIAKATLALVPREVAEGRRLIPFLIEDEKLFVAMANPGDKRMLDELEFVTALKVFPYVTMESALERTIESAYDAVANGKSCFEGADVSKRKAGSSDPSEVDDLSVGAGASVVVDDDTKQAAETSRINTTDFGDTRDEISSVMNIAPIVKVPGQDTVLVVDDDEDIRKLVRRLLTEKGFRVVEAKKGDEALHRVKEGPVDLIILDAMLPEVHGFDIAKQLKGSEKYGHIPIIMISAEHRGWRIAEDVKNNYGIDEYVEKPFVASAFFQTIARVLAKTKEKKTAPRDPEDIRADAKAALDEGVKAYKEGRVQEAIDTLKRGIKLDPLAYRLRYHLGLLYGKQGRVHDGVHELERAVELHPKAFMAVKNLAVLYEKAGFKNKAVEQWEKCLELAPDDETRRQIKDHLASLV